MLPGLAEIFRGLNAAWRIALFDPAAMRHFDLSERGFWRSFWAFALCLPFLLLSSRLFWFTAPPEQVGDQSFAMLLIVQVGIFALSWGGFLLLMVPVAQLLGLGSQYVPYVIAWNWSQALLHLVMIPPTAVVILLDDASSAATASLGMFALILSVSYSWLVARVALAVGGLLATAVVLLELLVVVLLQALTSAF